MTVCSAIQKSGDQDRATVELNARINLAEARGRLALAEGRPDDAIRNFTAVVAGREKAALRYLKNSCGSLEEWRCLQKEVAYARARLAEVKGQPEEMAAELRKALAFQENVVQMYRRLLQFGAVNPEQVIAAQKELTDIRSRLDRAERLVRKKELLDGGIS